ncbi:MAG: DegT/DnrJ/EryC1/StrS aminotransferase family protein [Pseudomonadota bacterium]
MSAAERISETDPGYGPWPHYEDDEVGAVVDVLHSGRVNQWTGDRVLAFQDVLADAHQMPHAIAVANGTLALELALRAFEIGPGDEVIVSPRSFVASATVVDLVGATPVFADVDRDSQNVTVETVSKCLSSRTKAVMAVHVAGWPCDAPALANWASQNGIRLIEDCAQAHGASVQGRSVGSFGDASAFSFCQDKIISTGGEGGAVLFRDRAAWERAWSFKDHGKAHDKVFDRNPPPGFRWLVDSVGTNYRMTEMQAAIGIVQYRKLERWVARRRANAQAWFAALSRCPNIRIPVPDPAYRHAHYRAYAFLVPDQMRAATTREDIFERLRAEGLPAFSGACPEIYREHVYAHRDIAPLPVAAELGQTSLMFDVHHRMDPVVLEDVAERTAAVIASFARENGCA